MPAYNVVCERKRLPLQRAIRVFFLLAAIVLGIDKLEWQDLFYAIIWRL